ncbi:DNA-protecting protein DprA [Candidatus Roizmanbacteria bacterium]|nr:DNA-protecting protein DprA [Candidatus Roizmanbacteria bacterium]
MDNRAYYLGFSQFLGIGPMRFQQLLSHFKNVKAAYEAPEKELKKILGEALTPKFLNFRRECDLDGELNRCQKKGIAVVTQEDNFFPSSLKNISDPPICLYIKGEVGKYRFDEGVFFAIVGTRTPTSYGRSVAHQFASALAAAGLVIVSGLALGIDGIAHQAAVEAGGRTIAFLGCGVDIVYPSSHANLYGHILSSGGLIISEFPPGRTVLKGLFIARNRLISGLCRGVMVVEGGRDSGSLITARYAALQGKEVFAPPAPITSSLSEAPNLLLKEGAVPVTSPTDIFQSLQLEITPRRKAAIQTQLSEEDNQLFEKIAAEPLSADELALFLHRPSSEILSSLSSLELQGIVEKNRDGKYQTFAFSS